MVTVVLSVRGDGVVFCFGECCAGLWLQDLTSSMLHVCASVCAGVFDVVHTSIIPEDMGL